jgi:hypothetical protein
MTRLGDYMRLPTPKDELFAWWNNALLGHLAEDLPLEDAPQCGFFKRRLVRNGPFVPAKIWLYQPIGEGGELEGDEKLQCEVNGKFADPELQWEWLRQNPITEAEYNYLVAAIDWTKENAPDQPMANERTAVDWNKIPTPTFTKEQPQ